MQRSSALSAWHARRTLDPHTHTQQYTLILLLVAAVAAVILDFAVGQVVVDKLLEQRRVHALHDLELLAVQEEGKVRL